MAGAPPKERASLQDTAGLNEQVPRLGIDNIKATPAQSIMERRIQTETEEEELEWCGNVEVTEMMSVIPLQGSHIHGFKE